jgi:RNA polymerase sigma-70 factor (family 1)
MKDEAVWLKKLSQGSELAFTKIFDHYRPHIYRVSLNMLKNTIQAEEVVQDVFLKIWTDRESLNSIENFDGFIFMMARNNIYDRFKKKASEQKAFTVIKKQKREPVNHADHPLIEQQYFDLLQKTLSMLPDRQKQIYHLSRDKGMNYKQIGQQLNISPLTVKKHMAEALKFIRRHLEVHLGIFALFTFLYDLFW